MRNMGGIMFGAEHGMSGLAGIRIWQNSSVLGRHEPIGTSMIQTSIHFALLALSQGQGMGQGMVG